MALGLQLVILGIVAAAAAAQLAPRALAAGAWLLAVVDPAGARQPLVALPQVMLLGRCCLPAVVAMEAMEAPGQEAAAPFAVVLTAVAVVVLVAAASMPVVKTSHLAVAAPSQAAAASAVLAAALRTPALLAAGRQQQAPR